MAVTSTKATAAQRAWLQQYEDQTGMEPMHQDELDSGEMSWNDLVQANVDWFEAWAMDCMRRIQKNNPASLEDSEAA